MAASIVSGPGAGAVDCTADVVSTPRELLVLEHPAAMSATAARTPHLRRFPMSMFYYGSRVAVGTATAAGAT